MRDMPPMGWGVREEAEHGAFYAPIGTEKTVVAFRPAQGGWPARPPEPNDAFVLVQLTAGDAVLSERKAQYTEWASLTPSEWAAALTTTEALVAATAAAFVEALREDLGWPLFRAACERNRTETSETICHSHDFCDANEVMADAIRTASGWEIPEDIEGTEYQRLWIEAWTRAREAMIATVRS